MCPLDSINSHDGPKAQKKGLISGGEPKSLKKRIRTIIVGYDFEWQKSSILGQKKFVLGKPFVQANE